jgi:drug/metabolite transporter (DMT)-like permease
MNAPALPGRFADLGPGIVAAVAFALSDVFAKVAFAAGMDPLSLSTFRSAFSVICMIAWFWLQPPATPHTPRERNISL